MVNYQDWSEIIMGDKMGDKKTRNYLAKEVKLSPLYRQKIRGSRKAKKIKLEDQHEQEFKEALEDFIHEEEEV